MLRSVLLACGLAALLSSPLHAGEIVRVTFRGEVEFNGISAPPLGNAAPGQDAEITFTIDSDVFVDSGAFPTRGYEIDTSSYELSFGGTTIGLASPFPGTPYFVLRNDDPAVDGFFTSTNVNVPAGLALQQTGVFGPFAASNSVTYVGTTLTSLDILDALGTYDFTGLTVFNWTVDDGPFNPLGFVFASLEIALDTPTWSDQGCALAGAAGEPALSGVGDLSDGSQNALRLLGAAPNAPAALFFSTSSGAVPFKGGTIKPFPFFTPITLATNGNGAILLPFTMPTTPSGTEIWLQIAIADAGAPVGVALSNALRGITP